MKGLALIAFSVLLLFPVGAQNAFGSLIGDTMHVKVTDVTTNTVACDEDVVVVDPGFENLNCFGTTIDIDGDSILFQLPILHSTGTTVNANLFEFTNMDWRDDSGNLIQGKITGVTVTPPHKPSY